MVVSVVSTNTLLGVPAEVYSYGAQFGLYGIGVIFATTFVGTFFVPLMFPLKMTSAHEVCFNSQRNPCSKVRDCDKMNTI